MENRRSNTEKETYHKVWRASGWHGYTLKELLWNKEDGRVHEWWERMHEDDDKKKKPDTAMAKNGVRKPASAMAKKKPASAMGWETSWLVGDTPNDHQPGLY